MSSEDVDLGPIDANHRYPNVGQQVSVVRSLCDRIAIHSPELVMQIQYHLERNNEPIDARRSFSGQDASALLCFAMIEALLAYEQIRLELMQQSGHNVPANQMRALATGMRMEPALISMAKDAFDLHLQLWNAHSLVARRRSSKASGAEPEEEELPHKNADPWDDGEGWEEAEEW